jgi:hypothetical protein
LATKSVSQLISKMLPSLPSAAMWIATTPSAATRVAALLALLPSLTRRISSAFAMSPAASVSAFLHSIIGASVLARSSLTMLAVISAIALLQIQSIIRHDAARALGAGRVAAGRPCDYSAASTSTNSSSPASCCTTSLMPWLLPSRMASATPRAYRRIGLGRVVVAGDHVVDAFGRVVGVDHADHRDAQLLGFGHGDLVVADVDDEHGVGQRAHVLMPPMSFSSLAISR